MVRKGIEGAARGRGFIGMRRVAFLIVAAVGLTMTAPLRADGPGDSRRLVEMLAEKAVTALAAREERVHRFCSLLNEHFDIELIGRWVLGRYWRESTSEQRAEFNKLYEQMIVNSYVDKFAEYSGEKLAVKETAGLNEDDILVRSQLVRPTAGPPVRVDWRLRARDGHLRIVDVIV